MKIQKYGRLCQGQCLIISFVRATLADRRGIISITSTIDRRFICCNNEDAALRKLPLSCRIFNAGYRTNLFWVGSDACPECLENELSYNAHASCSACDTNDTCPLGPNGEYCSNFGTCFLGVCSCRYESMRFKGKALELFRKILTRARKREDGKGGRIFVGGGGCDRLVCNRGLTAQLIAVRRVKRKSIEC